MDNVRSSIDFNTGRQFSDLKIHKTFFFDILERPKTFNGV